MWRPWRVVGLFRVLLGILLSTAVTTAREEPSSTRVWAIVERRVSQTGGLAQAWQIDYVVRYVGDAALFLPLREVSARVTGWVSNSRIPGHHIPIQVDHALNAGASPFGSIAILSGRDETAQCQETARLELWRAGERGCAAGLVVSAFSVGASQGEPLRRGDCIHARVTLEHCHFLYGQYEALLGPRTIGLRLGESGIRDELMLVSPNREARTALAWPELRAPSDRADTRWYVSPPESLRLSAEAPGRSFYRISGPVRFGSRVRIRFWYMTCRTPGTRPTVRITQLKQGPGLWKTLGHAQLEFALPQVSGWTHYEREVWTDDEATTLSIELSVAGEAGEVWFDELTVEPADGAGHQP